MAMRFEGRTFHSFNDMFNYAYEKGDWAFIEKWKKDATILGMRNVLDAYDNISRRKEQDAQKAAQEAEKKAEESAQQQAGAIERTTITDTPGGPKEETVKQTSFQALLGEVPEELSKNEAVRERIADLSQKMTGQDQPTGPDAVRSMLANRARQGILGAASAGGGSSATEGQQSSMRQQAEKAIGQKEILGVQQSMQEKDAARAALASLKQEVVDSDIRAKEQFKKRRAKLAIGLEGIKETARQAAYKGVVINK